MHATEEETRISPISNSICQIDHISYHACKFDPTRLFLGQWTQFKCCYLCLEPRLAFWFSYWLLSIIIRFTDDVLLLILWSLTVDCSVSTVVLIFFGLQNISAITVKMMEEKFYFMIKEKRIVDLEIHVTLKRMNWMHSKNSLLILDNEIEKLLLNFSA